MKFLTTLPDARDRIYGIRLREALRELFGVIHRRELLTAEWFQAHSRRRGQGATMRHTERASDKPLSQPGEAV